MASYPCEFVGTVGGGAPDTVFRVKQTRNEFAPGEVAESAVGGCPVAVPDVSVATVVVPTFIISNTTAAELVPGSVIVSMDDDVIVAEKIQLS